MPQNDTKVESMGAKTIPGVFIGYHIHAGGLWSGDYYVAALAPSRKNGVEVKSKVKIYRIKEVVTNHSGKFKLPIAVWREKNDSSSTVLFGIPADYDELPDISFEDNDEGGDEGHPKGDDSSDDEGHNGAFGCGLDRSLPPQ